MRAKDRNKERRSYGKEVSSAGMPTQSGTRPRDWRKEGRKAGRLSIRQIE